MFKPGDKIAQQVDTAPHTPPMVRWYGRSSTTRTPTPAPPTSACTSTKSRALYRTTPALAPGAGRVCPDAEKPE